jgi:hypothetical protein
MLLLFGQAAQVLARTAADELAAGGAGLPLLLGGSGSGITETTAHSQGFTREASDAITGGGGLPLLLGGSGTGISETVAEVHTPAAPVELVRSVADSVGDITETVAIPATQLVGYGGEALRYLFDKEPRHYERFAHERIEFIYEHVDTFYVENEDWVIDLDLLQLVEA